MEIASFDKFNQTGISLIGKLCTLNDYQQLRNYLNNLKITGNYLILDLSRLTFSSSHGLGEFVAISNTLKKTGIKVILLNPREEIKAIITLAGIDQIITVIINDSDLEQLLNLEKKNTQ